jgi:hypothetical protein
MKNLIFFALLFTSFFSFSQEVEDEKKMIREIVTVEVERAKLASNTAEADTKNVQEKKVSETETPVEEVPDTLPPIIPAPQQEILKRAQNWYTLKNNKFEKINGANTDKLVTCGVIFPFKQKQLNPENEIDGKITMDIVIEAKEGKYRYTIKNIKHVANKKGMSGGDIYAKLPEAGSMLISDRTWKSVRAESYACVKILSNDLKATMKLELQVKKEDW